MAFNVSANECILLCRAPVNTVPGPPRRPAWRPAPVVAPGDGLSSREIMETEEFLLTGNGVRHTVRCEPDTPLLDVLRHDVGLAGPGFGCGLGLCGACMVLTGGRARSSCDLPVSAVDSPVTTVEGLPSDGRLHP